MFTKEALTEVLEAVNGKRRQRVLQADEALETWQQYSGDPKARTIRVYPGDAFVPNGYKWRAVTTYVEFRRGEDGEWSFVAHGCDAHRAHGQGATVTINGRAAY